MKTAVLQKLNWLAQFGKDDQMGITRFVYTEPWQKAQQALQAWLEQEGFIVEIDAAGNLLANVKGTVHPYEVVLTGSHLDTVTHGGIYDGQYGIVGGALAIINLVKKYGAPQRTLQLVAFAEEEGSRFPFAMWGSKSMFGQANLTGIEGIKDGDGISMEEAMRKLGYTGEQAPKRDVRAFIELHIEQGSVLEKEQKEIGVVHSIVGQRRYNITVSGEANHAGTTPMGFRRDAMKAASSMISTILSLTEKMGDPLVATVGNFTLEPNISNVVPKKAIFTLDVRHTNEAKLDYATTLMTSEIHAIAEKQKVEVEIETWFSSNPVAMDEGIFELVRKSCEKKDVQYKLMYSGAAHDAQIVAPLVPTAMLFVPSQAGISHSPLEYTDEQSLEKGIEVLEEALFQLAY